MDDCASSKDDPPWHPCRVDSSLFSLSPFLLFSPLLCETPRDIRRRLPLYLKHSALLAICDMGYLGKVGT